MVGVHGCELPVTLLTIPVWSPGQQTGLGYPHQRHRLHVRPVSKGLRCMEEGLGPGPAASPSGTSSCSGYSLNLGVSSDQLTDLRKLPAFLCKPIHCVCLPLDRDHAAFPGRTVPASPAAAACLSDFARGARAACGWVEGRLTDWGCRFVCCIVPELLLCGLMGPLCERHPLSW